VLTCPRILAVHGSISCLPPNCADAGFSLTLKHAAIRSCVCYRTRVIGDSLWICGLTCHALLVAVHVFRWSDFGCLLLDLKSLLAESVATEVVYLFSSRTKLPGRLPEISLRFLLVVLCRPKFLTSVLISSIVCGLLQVVAGVVLKPSV
jgi:hypothetical protein